MADADADAGLPDGYWTYRRTPAHTEFRRARDLLWELREDQDAALAAFAWPRSRSFNWALEWFDVIARGQHRAALSFPEADGRCRDVSFHELSAASDRVANWLRGLGVRRGERVLVALGPQRELWEVLLGCLKAGVVVVPAYTSLTPAEAADRVTRGGIRHVICRDDLAGLFGHDRDGLRIAVPGNLAGWHSYGDAAGAGEHFLPDGDTAADAVAFCYFTSGTTSAPKLVAHTHSSYPVGHLSSMFWNGLLAGDRHLNVSAPGWAKHSWSSLFVPWNAEATIVVPPSDTDFSDLPRLAAGHAVTSMCAPASTWRAVRPYLDTAVPRLREATTAGEPLSAHLATAVERAWGVRLREGYGQTEATAMIGTGPALPGRPGRLGKVLPGYRLTLRDPDGRPSPGSGEICVELGDDPPAGMMSGYLDATGRLTPPGPDFYRTGDLGTIDGDGYLTVVGRVDDVFKSFDHRISPYELEAVLERHPAVAEAAVVPVPHPVGGAVPQAVVVLSGHAGESEDIPGDLLRHCAASVPAEKMPRSVAVVPRLPRTHSGKIRRAALAEMVR
ncbi:AMP-binding protein [Streptomyces sp. NPDC047046]|uniref:AMP-binding protein n=1 Tax=Streptomyces sp. NPDC047046 TaxID=3155378 RepID=UPI0033D6E73D